MKLRERLEHFLKYVDESTYWKEDNDVPNHVIVHAYLEKFKPNGQLPGIVSKRPSDQEILQVLDLAQCELREMLKRNKYMGSTALFAVDNLYEVLKAACDSEKGGEKSVSGGNMGTYKPGDERYGG